MKRLARHLRTPLAALSLTLGLAAAGLWLRGHRVGDSLMLSHASADGPPWRSLLLQGWSSGGGLRLVLQVSRTSRAPVPNGVPFPPDFTPFGTPGWFTDHSTYSAEPYPFDTFADHALTAGGFQWSTASRPATDPSLWSRSLTVPAWFATSALLATPAWQLRQTLRRRRRAANPAPDPPRCPTCGYDLRATPARCPECGTAASHPA